MSAGPRLARRTALGLTAGVVALAGCEGSDDAPAGGSDPATEPDPDLALVEGVPAELARVRAIAAAAGAADLVALHDAHLDALSGAQASPTATPSASPSSSPSGSPSGSPTTPPATSASGRARDLSRDERALQRRLVDAAVAARSGSLAALLASMSAAQSQALTRVAVPR